MSTLNSGIYSIVSPSGKKYIGSSKNLSQRWKQHKYHLSRGDHHNRHLLNAWKKYSGNLEFQVLLVCEPTSLILYEQQYLDFYQPEYNISKHADITFNALGVKRSDETKKKISQANLGKTRKGHTPSEKTKQNLKEAMLGNKIWLGRRHSEESKVKMSLSRKGILRPSSKGRLISEKQKRFLSESRKGSKNPMYGRTQWNKKNVEA